jgi:hypothetical protein
LIRRQLGNSFGDFFDFHVAQYSTAAAWLNEGNGLGARARLLAERVCLLDAAPHVRGMTAPTYADIVVCVPWPSGAIWKCRATCYPLAYCHCRA